MPKNKLSDLNNHLFEQLEKLNDDSIVGEKLKDEVNRTKAMTSITKQILDSAKITLEAVKFTSKENNESTLPSSIKPEDSEEMRRLVGLEAKQ